MKNQKWGCFAADSRYHALTAREERDPWVATADMIAFARRDYEEKRSNGKWYDGPSVGMPADGSLEWVKGRVKGRNVCGVKESDGYYHYEVRYDEGPRDKAWMEERDWKYIQRLVDPSYGLCLLELEPNADKEIAADHRYRVEITRALEAARAGCRSLEKLEEKERAEREARGGKTGPSDLSKETAILKLRDSFGKARKNSLEQDKVTALKAAASPSDKKSSRVEDGAGSPSAGPAFSLKLIPYRTLTYGRLLGEGGFAKVYQGEWQHAKVAIKELLMPRLTAEALAEFKSETTIWGQLHHPNIVPLCGISVDEPQHYSMVMELMPQGSLYQVLHNGQPLNWEIRFHLAHDIAAGLTHLHEQDILHCDLKSMNVLLDGAMRAKLTDFGLSKIRIESRATAVARRAERSGTVAWMSPELLDGEIPRKESDIYSFGMILWELASREIPYKNARNDSILIAWIMAGRKETIPEECRRTYPSYAALIAGCWEERLRRPTIQEAAEVLRPLETAVEAAPAGVAGPAP